MTHRSMSRRTSQSTHNQPIHVRRPVGLFLSRLRHSVVRGRLFQCVPTPLSTKGRSPILRYNARLLQGSLRRSNVRHLSRRPSQSTHHLSLDGRRHPRLFLPGLRHGVVRSDLHERFPPPLSAQGRSSFVRHDARVLQGIVQRSILRSVPRQPTKPTHRQSHRFDGRWYIDRNEFLR